VSYGYVTPTGGFTVEAWFKRDTINATNTQSLFSQRTQAAVNWPTLAIHVQGRQFSLEINTSGALVVPFLNESTNTGTTIGTWTDPSPAGYSNDNQWHHVALRMGTNKTSYTVFLDGAVLGSGTTSAALNWKPGIMTFGAQYLPSVGNWGSYIWDDWLAYFAVFNKPLTDNRILEHYTAGSGGTVYYGDNEVVRLTRIFDWAEVPPQSRELEPALVNLQGIQVADTNALQAAHDTVDAASGVVFADGQTRMVYQNRQHRYNRWTVMTLSESLGAAPEVGMTFTIDDARIYNDVRGDRPYGSQVRMQDSNSRASHGRKTLSFSIPVTTHEELMQAVSWMLNQYGYPKVRVSNVSFRADSSVLAEDLGSGLVTIGDHIVLDELPEELAPSGTMEFIVEKVALSVDFRNGDYTVNLELSPEELAKVWQVGVTSFGDDYKVAY
jgi:hypothetical protein